MESKLNNPQVFPAGTTVKAYPTSNWPQSKKPPVGAPLGAATAEAVVAANGDLVFVGLVADTHYYAVAEVGGAYRYERLIPASPEPTLVNLAGRTGELEVSSAALTKRVSALEKLELPAVPSGFWMGGWYAAANVTMINGTIYYLPIWTAKDTPVNKVGLRVVTKETEAAKLLRLGLYGVAANGIFPGAKIAELGNFAPEAAETKEIVIAQTVPAGLSFLATCWQGAGVGPVVLATAAGVPLIGLAPSASGAVGGFLQTGLAEGTALPANASAAPSVAETVPRIAVKVT